MLCEKEAKQQDLISLSNDTVRFSIYEIASDVENQLIMKMKGS